MLNKKKEIENWFRYLRDLICQEYSNIELKNKLKILYKESPKNKLIKKKFEEMEFSLEEKKDGIEKKNR